MSDIVEVLRRRADMARAPGYPLEQTAEWLAADEIQKLRDALQEIGDLRYEQAGADRYLDDVRDIVREALWRGARP